MQLPSFLRLTAVAIALVGTPLLADEESDFTLSTTPTAIVGQLRVEGKALDFASQEQSSGDVEIEVSYPGAKFQGTYHGEAGTLQIRGFGVKILPDDKALLQRAHDELVERMGAADTSDRTLFLLERLLLFLSDAPASFVWDEMELEIGVERQGTDETSPDGTLARARPFVPSRPMMTTRRSAVWCK